MKNDYFYQRNRGLKRKMFLIESKGGCCELCGYNKNLASLEFHHKDPSIKDFQLDLRKLSNSKMVDLLSEVEKCQLLCANCHRETHSPELEIEKVKLYINEIDNSVLNKIIYGKPKCLDCSIEINYSQTRCVKCNAVNRRKVEWPNLDILLKELNDNTQEWCAKKYGVSRSTIKRWIKKTENDK